MKHFAFAVLFIGALCAILRAQQTTDTLSAVSSAVAPIYSPLALSASVAGDVTVRVIVNDSGTVIGAEALTGREPLKHAALEAARRWKFQSQGHGTEAVLTFSFVIVPDGTTPEDVTTVFKPPYTVEVRRKLPQPTVNYKS